MLSFQQQGHLLVEDHLLADEMSYQLHLPQLPQLLDGSVQSQQRLSPLEDVLHHSQTHGDVLVLQLALFEEELSVDVLDLHTLVVLVVELD